MKFIFSTFKYIWRALNFIRDLVMNIVFLIFVLVLLSVIGIVIGADKQEKVALNGDQGALFLNLDGYLADNRDDQSDLKKSVKRAG